VLSNLKLDVGEQIFRLIVIFTVACIAFRGKVVVFVRADVTNQISGMGHDENETTCMSVLDGTEYGMKIVDGNTVSRVNKLHWLTVREMFAIKLPRIKCVNG
jgi:hypothetical protein